MRDRLIDSVKRSLHRHIGKSCKLAENIADDLLADGVIVAPMPMANWLRQELTEYVHKRCVEEL